MYFHVIRFTALRFLAYPHELWALALRRFVIVGLLIVFWSIVAQSSDGSIEYRPLTAYFLISSGVNDIISAQTLRLGKFMGDSIKRGTITISLIRPVNVIPYMLAINIGERSVGIALSLLSIAAGLIIHPPASLFSIAAFVFFFILAGFISLGLNIITATNYFYVPEASGIRFSIGHVIKVFSGAIVPISLFPEPLRSLVLLSPFPSLVFIPTTALQWQNLDASVLRYGLTGLFWSGLLLLIAATWWRISLRNYDAVGM